MKDFKNFETFEFITFLLMEVQNKAIECIENHENFNHFEKEEFQKILIKSLFALGIETLNLSLSALSEENKKEIQGNLYALLKMKGIL